MLEIKAIAKNEHRVVPDIGGNLELPENDRFAVVIQRRHTIMMQTEAVTAGGKFSFRDFIRPSIKRLENAPLINFGNVKRAMEIDDMFDIEVLEPVLDAVFDKISELKNGVAQTKN
jgi:hypothetical protein